MVNVRFDERVDFMAISTFPWAKTTNVKRLRKMRRMSRQTKRDDVLFLAICLKPGGMVAFVTIEYQQSISKHP